MAYKWTQAGGIAPHAGLRKSLLEILNNHGRTIMENADDMQVGGSHYKEMPVQPWTVMQAVLTPEEWRGYLKGNII